MGNQIKLPHLVIVKAPGLLSMLYKPSELAGDLGVPDRTLRDWLAAGAPHMRDDKNRIWVNGREFAAWVSEQRKPKSTEKKLTNDQAYCLRCKKAVALVNPTVQHGRGKLILITGKCPQCGCTINRGGRDD